MPKDMVEKITSQKNLWVVLLEFFKNFQGILYDVVILGNDFDFVKWLGLYVECICCDSM